MSVALSVRQYGVAFGNKSVLTGINFDLPEQGLTVLMGPCGTGKSTLLRSLAGLNNASSAFCSSGSVYYLGEPLGRMGYPLMTVQKPSVLGGTVKECIVSNLEERETLTQAQSDHFVCRLIAAYNLKDVMTGGLDAQVKDLSMRDRRLTYMLAAIAASPKVVFFDEPTTDLTEDDANYVLDLVAKISCQRSVMVVLHNQKQAQRVGDGHVMLLAGGKIQEHVNLQEFFLSPLSEAGKEFVRTGSCAAPSHDTDPEYLDPEFIDKYKPVVSELPAETRITPFGTSGFKWIIRDSLAAMPRPGLLEDLDFDLAALRKIEIDEIVTLEEFESVPKDAAEKYGMRVYWFPIVDMGVPDAVQLNALLTYIKQNLLQGRKVAVHCRAGLGRTGTVIVAFLVWDGMELEKAMHIVRCVDQRILHKIKKKKFLIEFAKKAGAFPSGVTV